MSQSIYSGYPPELTPDRQQLLVTAVKNWAIQHDLTVLSPPSAISAETGTNEAVPTNAPVTLFPSPFPRACFAEATALQAIYNKLYASITCDEEWLGDIVQG